MNVYQPTKPRTPVPSMAAAQAPTAYPAPPVAVTNEERVEIAEQALAAALARKEADDKREAEVRAFNQEQDRISDAAALADATVILLHDILQFRKAPGVPVPQRDEYAKHRKALQPVAAEYGYRLVLIGNRNRAALVVA